MATQMTVQEQSLLISSYHITVTLDIQFLVQILQGFVRVMENGLGLHPSVRKVVHAWQGNSMYHNDNYACITYHARYMWYSFIFLASITNSTRWKMAKIH